MKTLNHHMVHLKVTGQIYLNNIRGVGSIPELGRFPGGGHGNPLQYSCLENPKDRRAWWAIVYRVTKSWT